MGAGVWDYLVLYPAEVPQTRGVYFLATPAESELKIGSANNIAQRTSTIQSGHYLDLALVGYIRVEPSATRRDLYSLERACQKQLKTNLLRGEWFNVAHIESRDAMRRMFIDLAIKAERDLGARQTLALFNQRKRLYDTRYDLAGA